MPVISDPYAFNEDDLYVDLKSVFGDGHALFLKCEGFNFAGSIKLKAAVEMVEAAERDGTLGPDSILVESSSGNLGVALSMIAASKGYQFLCVTDSRCNLSTRLMMEALGSQVHVIAGQEANGGFLGARLDYVRALCASDSRYVWLSQYTNPSNWKAHHRTTAPEIARSFPQLDVLFIGAGTTGTLMGCARFFREWHRPVRIIALDSVGSVAFGGPPGRRMIPGLGMSMRPPLLDESYVDEVIRVEEVDTIRACHRLARHGFLFGGSTGTVVSGALGWLDRHWTPGLTAVAIAPDLGERYLDTVYHANWLEDLYGDELFNAAADTDAEAESGRMPAPEPETADDPSGGM
ncbi:2,3-diaminopropionate biosynthesis protein SbnA [Streptomyces sp. SCSIO 30461]|uniref:2,3-diaminopropionate biosynthesis protein SbnA n=1 Tax=Streptomyces sp. SCSIO 30461 TaxID=3118085 RepID=UPI0030CC9DB7